MRLMGFDDEDYYRLKESKISNSQQNGKKPWFTEQGSGHIEEGINLIVVSENEEIDINIEEIK